MSKNWLLKNMSNFTNTPNQKYLCQPPPKNAKFQKLGIKICQLATLPHIAVAVEIYTDDNFLVSCHLVQN